MILIGVVIMVVGLFMVVMFNKEIFELGLVMIIIGNGLFKFNIFMMVGKFYGLKDECCDLGFIIFYMGINIGVMIVFVLI